MALNNKGDRIEFMMPSPLVSDMLEQIGHAREQVASAVGLPSLFSSLSAPEPPGPMTATMLMHRLREQTRQVSQVPNIYEDSNITVAAEDWSDVRSPGRARRRRHKHRQNIRHWRKPSAVMIEGRLYVHPEIMAAIRRRADGIALQIDKQLLSSLNYGRQP